MEPKAELDSVKLPLHSDFQRFRFTKPVRQMIIFVALMLVGIGIKVWQRDYSYAGFFAVMIVGASGPFIYLYRTHSREMIEWGGAASAVFERTAPVPVRVVLFDLVENRLRVVDVKIEDHAARRVVAARLTLGSGAGLRPAFATEFDAVARIDEGEKIAIVDAERYRMWCKILSVEDMI